MSSEVTLSDACHFSEIWKDNIISRLEKLEVIYTSLTIKLIVRDGIYIVTLELSENHKEYVVTSVTKYIESDTKHTTKKQKGKKRMKKPKILPVDLFFFKDDKYLLQESVT